MEDHDGRVVFADAPGGGVELRGEAFSLRKILAEDARCFGLGDKTGPLDRSGQAFQLWNTDAYAFQESTDPLYKAVPFVLTTGPDGASSGFFLDNTFLSASDFGRV